MESQINLPIKIKAHPNKKKTEIIGIEDNTYIVNIKAPAEKNKANIELIKFFSKLSGKQVKLIHGKSSKNKIIG